MNNSHNVPLLRQKAELHSSISGGADFNLKSLNLETAYSFTDNLAVMANYMSFKNKEYPYFGEKGKYSDVALGYYITFGKLGKFKKPLIWDIYLGYGNQKQHHNYSSSSNTKMTADLRLHKPFIQTSIGVTFNAIDFAFSSRFAYVTFYSISHTLDKSRDYDRLESFKTNGNVFLIEPAITSRLGWKYVKLQAQISTSYNFNPEVINYKLNLSVGIVIKLTDRYSSK